jgi:hypothetical protein
MHVKLYMTLTPLLYTTHNSNWGPSTTHAGYTTAGPGTAGAGFVASAAAAASLSSEYFVAAPMTAMVANCAATRARLRRKEGDMADQSRPSGRLAEAGQSLG